MMFLIFRGYRPELVAGEYVEEGRITHVFVTCKRVCRELVAPGVPYESYVDKAKVWTRRPRVHGGVLVTLSSE